MKLKNAARASLPVGLVALVWSSVVPASAESTGPIVPEPVDDGVDGGRIEVIDRTFDRDGTLLDDQEWSADYSSEELEAGVAFDGDATADPGSSSGGGGAVASGCRNLDVSMWFGRTYPGGFQSTYFVYHQNKRWCWNSPAGVVDGLHWYDYFTEVDSIWYDRGQVQNQAHHYAAWSGYSKSGHKSFTQRHIENCLVHCIGGQHPWADVHAFADGAYWFNVGL